MQITRAACLLLRYGVPSSVPCDVMRVEKWASDMKLEQDCDPCLQPAPHLPSFLFEFLRFGISSHAWLPYILLRYWNKMKEFDASRITNHRENFLEDDELKLGKKIFFKKKRKGIIKPNFSKFSQWIIVVKYNLDAQYRRKIILVKWENNFITYIQNSYL